MQRKGRYHHHAAKLEITTCIDDPVQDMRTNGEGTLNVFNVAVKQGIKKVIYASSACVYGEAKYIPQDEKHPKNPNWPYGVSKYAAEKYADIYHSYDDIDTIGLRYAIIYGEREWYGRVLTIFLKRGLEGTPPVEGNKDIPFDIERVYYLYDVPGGEARGGHAHKELEQVIVSILGSFDVVLDEGRRKKTVRLDRAYH